MCRLALCLLILFQNHDLDSDNAKKTDDAKPAIQTISVKTPPGTKWGYYYFLILNDKTVQKELEFSPSQSAELAKLTDAFLAKRIITEPADNNANDGANKNRKPRFSSESPMKAIGQLGDPAVKILTEEQKKRLEQIIFQLRKVEIFFYPDITEAFNLSAEQLEEIPSIRSWIIEEAVKLNEEYAVKKKNPKEYRRLSMKLLDEGLNRFVKSFSPEQLNKLKLMEGKKISFTQTDMDFTLRPTKSPEKDSSAEKKKSAELNGDLIETDPH